MFYDSEVPAIRIHIIFLCSAAAPPLLISELSSFNSVYVFEFLFKLLYLVGELVIAVLMTEKSLLFWFLLGLLFSFLIT